MPLVVSSLNSAWAGQATVNWNQNAESDLSGYKVHYGTAPRTTTPYTTTIDVGLTGTPSSPQATVSGLTDGFTYYFAVTAYDTSLNESGFSVEVLKLVTDTAPPVISSINTGSITDITATISWTTDEGADSLVEYGLETNYGTSTPLDSNYVTAHAQSISLLSASTLYHFRVRSTDAAGNESLPADNTFTTRPLPSRPIRSQPLIPL